jgi:hypothetical protein
VVFVGLGLLDPGEALRGIIDATSAATAAAKASVVFRATGVGDSGEATDPLPRSSSCSRAASWWRQPR